MTNKEIAIAWFSAIDKKDFDTIKKLVHPEHQFINPMTPAPAGIDEHIGLMQMMSSAFSGEHKLDLIIEDRDHVAVRARYVSQHTGDFNGIPATGKPVVLTFIDIFEIVNGKVRQEILEMNPMTIMAQLGVMAPA